MKSKSLFAVVLLLSMVLAACGSSGKATFPVGRYIKSGSAIHGVSFKADGTYTVFDGPELLVSGTYTADGDTITETSNSAGCSTNIKFKYTFDGQNLTLNYAGNPAEDAACSGRQADFNNVNYTVSK